MKTFVKKILGYWRWLYDFEGWSAWLHPVLHVIWIAISIIAWGIMQELIVCAISAVMGMAITGINVHYWTEFYSSDEWALLLEEETSEE